MAFKNIGRSFLCYILWLTGLIVLLGAVQFVAAERLHTAAQTYEVNNPYVLALLYGLIGAYLSIVLIRLSKFQFKVSFFFGTCMPLWIVVILMHIGWLVRVPFILQYRECIYGLLGFTTLLSLFEQRTLK